MLRLRVTILLCHTEIDNVNDIRGFGSRATNEEVVWLDVTIDEMFFVDCLYPRKHLLRNHHNRLDGEPSAAMIKKVFKRGTEEIDNEDVVETLLSKVVDVGNAS